MKKQSKKIDNFWLYHPALKISERKMTGRYRPAGIDRDGTPLIEIEFFDKT